MNVKAVTCFIIDGLRHKTRDEAMSCSQGSDSALHANNLIGQQHHVITVRHINFELTGRRLFDNPCVGQILRFERYPQCLQ